MKKVTTVLSLVLAVTLLSVACKDKASNKVETNNVENAALRDKAQKKLPTINFQKLEHDFGTIPQNSPQETTFTFTNTGDAPLIITDAKSDCGCTIPEYPKNTPIAPGESGELLVKFNGSGQNQVTKTITLTTNTEKGQETLRIRAFVKTKGMEKAIPVK